MEDKQFDYKSAYESERLKTADLSERIAKLEEERDEAIRKLDKIKGSKLWALSSPFRKFYHYVKRQNTRVKNLGSIRGIIAKIGYKKRERKAMSHFGTASFPDEAKRLEQSQTIFPNMVKVSILTPVYNTPEKFLRDMIESVMDQTYQNWQLCLADGSDDDHAYVGEIIKEYQAKDGKGRIAYQKLKVNDGISGNTNECLKMADGEYIGLFDHDDILHPEVLQELRDPRRDVPLFQLLYGYMGRDIRVRTKQVLHPLRRACPMASERIRHVHTAVCRQ